MGNVNAEAAMTVAGGAAEDGPGAQQAITHGPRRHGEGGGGFGGDGSGGGGSAAAKT